MMSSIMKIQIKGSILLLMMCLSGSLLFANHGAEKVLKRIDSTYRNKDYRAEISINSYAVASSKVPINASKLVYAQHGKFIKQQSAQQTVLHTDKWSLTVVPDMQYMLLINRMAELNNGNGFIDMDHLNASCNVIDVTTDSSGSGLLVFKLNDASQFNGVERVELAYDPSAFEIQKITFYYEPTHEEASKAPSNTLQRVEMTYTQFEMDPVWPEDFFDIAQYLNITNDSVQLTETYKNYHFSDRRNTENHEAHK